MKITIEKVSIHPTGSKDSAGVRITFGDKAVPTQAMILSFEQIDDCHALLKAALSANRFLLSLEV